MTEETADDADAEWSSNDAAVASAAASTYKVLGEFSDDSGAGVLGRNTASSGTPIGVQGAVPNSSDGYGLHTPDDARVEGTMATTGVWQVDVDGDAGVQLTASDTFEADGFTYEGTGNAIVGHLNDVGSNVVGGTVGGGGLYDQDNDESLGNAVTDHFNTVGGGYDNTAGDGDGNPISAFAATVAGGRFNVASALYATIAGGSDNEASADSATVAGGDGNTAGGTDSTVGGGSGNGASGSSSTVAGGNGNEASESNATVAGGSSNAAEGSYAVVAGGGFNTARGLTSTVGGGDSNDVYDDYGTVGGGQRNQAGSDDGDTSTATLATVGGGGDNVASATNATVGGGSGNTASADNATVPGGLDNVASGSVSFAAGREASATDDGAFVWSDSNSTSFSSTGPDQFLIDAAGGVGIGTASPSGMLDVDGDATVAGLATLGGNAIVGGQLNVNDDTTVDGSASVKNDLDVEGAVGPGSTSQVRIASDAETQGNHSVTGGLTVSNDATVNGGATVGSDASVDGDLDVSGTVRRDAMTQVYLGSLFTVSSGTKTVMPLDRDVLDEPAAWNTSTYEYTCPGDGHYQVTLNVKFAGAFSGDATVVPEIRVNGSTSYKWQGTAFAGEVYERSFTATLAGLSSGDTVDFTIEQRSGNDKNMSYGQTGPRASIRYLGDGRN